MGRVLIISATKGTNLSLANKIGNIVSIDHEIITLEDFIMPLYIPNLEIPNSDIIKIFSNKFIKSKAFIFCAPEYNGGSPPILTNAITWLSVITSDFRDLFSNKKALIPTHSGGAGFRFLSTFRVQLEHLGVIVFPRNIIVNRNKQFSNQSAKKIIKEFEKLL